jgi:hypothetical protein
MKRRINSTGRVKILRGSFEISMLEAEIGQPLKAKASLELSEYNFPETASVVIEAYHRSSGQRFDCGTVAEPVIPSELVLNEVDHSGSVLFRIKVIDNDETPGMLLGSAERISPKSSDGDAGRKSLFPVIYRDLGHEVWKVENLPMGPPELALNKALPEIKHKLKSNPLIQGFLLPAALRVVLEELIRDSDGDGDEGESWREEWKDYCKSELGIADNPPDMGGSEEDKSDWIDRAVKGFCRKFNLVNNIKNMQD